MKDNLHSFKKYWDSVIIKLTDIVFFPVAVIVNSLVLTLSSEKQVRANKILSRLTTPGIRFLSLIMFIVMVTSIIFTVYYQISPPKNSNLAGDAPGLPYQEKIADGVWALKNREPLHQVLASSKEDLNLKQVERSKLKVKSEGQEVYMWYVELGSGTKFEFGLVDSNTPQGKVMPKVRVVNSQKQFVEYVPIYDIPDTKYQFVTPKVKGNVISWEISEGITARYTMMTDRVKADYIVNSKSSIVNGQLPFDFEVSDGTELQELPDGDIILMDSKTLTEVFTIPAPVVFDSKSQDPNSKSQINSNYQLDKTTNNGYKLAIVLDEKDLENATFPLTIDPVVIYNGATSAESLSYPNGRRLFRDAYGNLFAFFDGGTGNDSVWYQNYNSKTWNDANIDIDNGGGSAITIAGDLDSTGSAHLVYVNDSDSDLEYLSLEIIRSGNNTITSIHAQARINLDTSDKAGRPSVVVANKGGGVGVEKIVVAYAMNTTSGGNRIGQIRVMQCDVAVNCTSASNWKNVSEEKNGSGTCADGGKGDVGLPNAIDCKGTADALFNYTAAHTDHHAVLTQMPYKPKRTPASVKKDLNSTFTTLTNTTDGNGGTTDDVNSLTTTDYIYIGDDKPFSKAIFDITNTNSNTQLFTTLEYYNGSTWTSLTNTVNNTATATIAFSEDGSLLFDEPGNWATTSVNGTSKYWIRMRPAGALDSSVSIAEVYVNDRNSGSLLVVGGVDATDDLRAAYIPWDDVAGDRWENNPFDPGGP